MSVSKTSPAGKGLRTAFQAIVGSLIGLVLAVWAVPGVPEVVTEYSASNWLPILLTIGVPSGIVAWIQNRAEER